jgi:hypothetical protein
MIRVIAIARAPLVGQDRRTAGEYPRPNQEKEPMKRTTLLALSLMAAGCGDGVDEPPNPVAESASAPEWKRGDRAIVLPHPTHVDDGYAPVLLKGHGGRGFWTVAPGTEVVVIGPGKEEYEVMVHVPGDAITDRLGIDTIPAEGVESSLIAGYLSRP